MRDAGMQGLLIGVELVEDRHSRHPAHELMQRATDRCLQLELNVNKAGGPSAVWRVAPPSDDRTSAIGYCSQHPGYGSQGERCVLKCHYEVRA
jgi:hypothetical protein